MIERKLVITGCGNCPFVGFLPIINLIQHGQHTCIKYDLQLEEPYNIEKTHDMCMLPINIKSENII